MKTQLVLWVPIEIKAEAKSRGVNLSHLFTEYINADLLSKKDNKTEQEQNIALKEQIVKLSEKIEEQKKEIKRLQPPKYTEIILGKDKIR